MVDEKEISVLVGAIRFANLVFRITGAGSHKMGRTYMMGQTLKLDKIRQN